MATILLTWELGAGMGHVMRLRPIGEALAGRGHRVVAAVQDLAKAQRHWAGTGIFFLAAPGISQPRQLFSPMRSYAHMLANAGLGNAEALPGVLAAWNRLFDSVAPDLVIADHSPLALLALQERPIPRANIGLGFFCPPDAFPLPYWLTDREQPYARQTIADERLVTQQVNRALIACGRAPLKRLAQIYGSVDATILATYAEFDHFGPRPKARYWGHWPFSGGAAPQWPSGSGPKIFAYVKAFPGLARLLELLRRLGQPTIVLGVEEPLRARYAAPHMAFASRPLDLRQVARQCDAAIHHAGHGTAVSLLLAGKPALLLPLYTEQLLFAQKVQALGAGILVDHPDQFAPGLNELLTQRRYRAAAATFAQRYAAFEPGCQIPELVAHLESLLARPPKTPRPAPAARGAGA